MTETFVKERKHNLTGKVEKVGIDDACAFLVPLRQRLAGHVRIARATPAGTRRCTRSRSTARTRRINWDLHDLHRLQYFDHRDEGKLRGWRSDPRHRRRPSVHGQLVGARPAIGYEHSFVHQVADFLEGLAKGKPASPTFRDALETQKICDAVLKSGKTCQWEKVGKSK